MLTDEEDEILAELIHELLENEKIVMGVINSIPVDWELPCDWCDNPDKKDFAFAYIWQMFRKRYEEWRGNNNCCRERVSPGKIGQMNWVIQLPAGFKANAMIRHSDGYRYLNVIEKDKQTGDYIIILDG